MAKLNLWTIQKATTAIISWMHFFMYITTYLSKGMNWNGSSLFSPNYDYQTKTLDE